MSKTYLKEAVPPAQVARDLAGVKETVAGVIADIRERGDEAVREYSAKFDNWSPEGFRLTAAQVDDIIAGLPGQVIEDITFVQAQVRGFARAQLASLREIELETLPGVFLGHKHLPVSSAGAYIPGGRYPLTASAHMTVLTAKAAGQQLRTPENHDAGTGSEERTVSVSSVLVVGGGITGSVLALALAQRGVRVTLAEVSPQWRGVGHGITVQGNLLAALDKVGVLGEVLDRGVPFNQLRMRQADGSLIAEVPTPRTGGPALPATMGALRSDLQAVLCNHVYAAGVTVRLGLSVRSVTQDSQRAYVQFTDGTDGRYNLVVGADGIRSAVRAMLGITTTPQATGMSIWRVVACRPAEMDCAEVFYNGPRYKAGYSPISAGQCYAYVLDVDGRLADFGDEPAWQLMYQRSAGYGGTWGTIRETIGADSNVSHTRIEWLLVDDPWYRGRAIVIGDAAHACPPLIAQGAAMCAEDAVVLAELVTGELPVEQALPAFMTRRMPRVELVVRNSMQLVRWEMGLEPHTEADVARTMNSTLGFLAAAEA